MGLDFIRKAAKPFHKGLDQSRIDLSTPDLFTQQPDCQSRAYAATAKANSELKVGEDICVSYNGKKVVAHRGMDIVAEFHSPPAELIDAINESYGEACGKVLEVHDIADIVEITVC